MKKETTAALLGRPLTSTESDNYDLYLKIAIQSLEDLLCTSLCDQADPKTYDLRVGYSTVFTDIFTELDEVKIDGDVVDSDKYSPRQWDSRTGSWFNSIVLDSRVTYAKEVEVSASWGFRKMPGDLQLLLSRMFDHISRQNKLDRTVSSKSVEDFSISFNVSSITMNDTLWQSLIQDNANTIARYAQCSIPYIRHGKVRHDHRYA